MTRFFTAFAVLLFSAGFATSSHAQDEEIPLIELMEGSYNSAQQAANDTDFYDITLHMYRIWESDDEQWLYVEQSVTAMPDRPYRQRLYRLEKKGKKKFLSHVYELKDPKAAIGKWNDPKWWDQFDASMATLKEGCAVHLKKTGTNTYEGSTNKADCKTQFRGATYATSMVTIEPGKVASWDQGWNDDKEQVWGAEKSGYIFLEVKE